VALVQQGRKQRSRNPLADQGVAAQKQNFHHKNYDYMQTGPRFHQVERLLQRPADQVQQKQQGSLAQGSGSFRMW